MNIPNKIDTMMDTNDEATQNPLILIVDDHAKDIQFIGNLLRKNNYRVAATTDSTNVPKRIKDRKPDLILLDVKMPQKNGFEVCREIQSEPELQEIPIIFLTIKDDQQDINYGLKLGGSDYITKPFNGEELVVRVDTHISLKQARDTIARKNNKLKNSIKTRDKLLSVISHDMRGVFFGINGLIGLVQEDYDGDEELQEYLEIANNSTLVANDYLENLLRWSQLQNEELELNMETFDIAEEVNKCIELYRSQIVHKSLEIQFDPQPVKIRADRNMLATVIRNLLSNAIKFSLSGGSIRLQISEEEDYTLFSIEDGGVGMSEDVRKHLFVEQQSSRKGTAQERGTGLGLKIVKDMLNKHDADINVESEEGKGTRFEVRIPIKEKN